MTVPLLFVFAVGLTVLKYQEGECGGKMSTTPLLGNGILPRSFSVSDIVLQVLWEHH